MYVFIVLSKFAVISVFALIVPLVFDHPLNVVVYPALSITVAVTSLPSLNVNLFPFVLYVVPLSTTILLVDTFPYVEWGLSIIQ